MKSTLGRESAETRKAEPKKAKISILNGKIIYTILIMLITQLLSTRIMTIAALNDLVIKDSE